MWNWATGLPFTPSYQNCNSDRDSGWCRPDVVGQLAGSATRASSAGLTRRSAPLAANGAIDGAWQRPTEGVQGNVGRNALWGPHFGQLDMSFFKTFAVTERLRCTIPRGVIQLHESHEFGAAEYLR